MAAKTVVLFTFQGTEIDTLPVVEYTYPAEIKTDTETSTQIAPVDSISAPVESLEDDEIIMEEEHLDYDSEMDMNDDGDQVDLQAAPGDDHESIHEEALPDLGEPIKSEITFDSEEEKPRPKHVYSWKELYNPKPPKKRPPQKVRKINEYRPKPKFVPHTCYICNTPNDDAAGLDTHLEGHVGLIPYKCEQCSTEQVPQEFKTLSTLNRHMRTHLYPYPCDFCPLRLPKKEFYEDHMRRFHDEPQQTDGQTCDFCGQHFTHRAQFRHHYAIHVAMKESRYKCEFCDKTFSNSFVLRRHRRVHTGEMPFECNKCGKKFNREDNYKNHMRHHINEKGYICSECGKRFVSSTALRYHMPEHCPDDPKYRPQKSTSSRRTRYENTAGITPKLDADGQKIFECKFEDCDFVTNTYSRMHYHLVAHERKFKCELCPKRYIQREALQNHVASVHEDKREYKFFCNYCPKMFTSKQYLRRHVDSHENNRRFKCQYCDKSFVQKVNLTAHERIHTGERPYACRICSTTFVTSSCRKKHEKTHKEVEIAEDEGAVKPEMDGTYEVIEEDGTTELVEFVQIQEQG